MTSGPNSGRTIDIVVVGGGGHATVAIEAAQAADAFRIVGFVDPSPRAKALLGVVWLGTDDALRALPAQGVTHAIVALGNNRLRQDVGAGLLDLGFRLPVIVHPTAQVSPSAQIGQGTIVMARACVGPLAVIGDLCIVNTAAIVEHDNVLGDAVHVAPGAALGGSVRIGARSLIGIGSAVCPDVSLGADVVVGAGAAVVSSFAGDVTLAGVPARPLADTTR